MVTLKDFMTAVDYRITEGSDFGWQCFGENAYCLDSWNGDYNGYSVSVTFDTKTQTVYLMEVCDYAAQRAYRLVNANFKEVFFTDIKNRGVTDDAWDGVKFIDLETVEDMLEKTTAIVKGLPYETSIQVPLDLNDDEIYQLMRLAHEKNITFNQLVVEILSDAIARQETVKFFTPD